jgi:hypothetical protein
MGDEIRKDLREIGSGIKWMQLAQERSCEYGDEPSGLCATGLVISVW